MERLWIQRSFGHALRLALGRFHNPLGYWNRHYHHGALLTDTVTRPRFLEFEDAPGAVLPMHAVGLLASGEQGLGGGLLSYELAVGNASSVCGGGAGDPCAGPVVVQAVGGWIALAAVLLLGPRHGRYGKDGRAGPSHPPSSIPFLALGAWMLSVGWFGFNVMSAQSVDAVNGLVALNSLMAMVGGVLAALFLGRYDPGFVHNGPLAGLVAICAGSDIVHPLGALAIGAVAGALFVWTFPLTQNRWRIDDVLGVWPLHGLCGAWGGIAAGIFGAQALGGAGGVSFLAQLLGTALGVAVALGGGYAVYGLIKVAVGLRLSQEEEHQGADLSIHRIRSEHPYLEE